MPTPARALERLLAPLGLLGQLLRSAPRLLPHPLKVLDNVVEELLGEPGVELLHRNATLGQRSLRQNDSVGELLGRLVAPLLLLLVHKLALLSCLLGLSFTDEESGGTAMEQRKRGA